MASSFSQRMARLSNEITALKVAKVKSVAKLTTITKTATISLEVEDYFYYRASNGARFTLRPKTSSAVLTSCCLNQTEIGSIGGSNYLQPVITREFINDSGISFLIYIAEATPNYANQILNFGLTFGCTSDFELSAPEYIDMGWTYG